MAADFEDLDSVENGLAHNAVFFVIEVCGNIGILSPLDDIQGTFHAVVKLVVAEGCQIVTCGVHQLDNGCALIHRTESGTLNSITGVDEENIAVGLGEFGLHTCDDVIAEDAVDIGVNVVGVKNGNSFFFGLCGLSRSCRLGGCCGFSRSGGLGGGCAAADQTDTQCQNQQKRQEFFHFFTSF